MGIILPDLGIEKSTPATISSDKSGSPCASTLADALFSSTQQRVLSLLFGQPGREFFVSELIALADCGRGSVQRELAKLAGSGLAVVSQVGNRKYYRANSESSLFDEICGIVRKTIGVEESIRAALSPLMDTLKLALIFGSVARRADSTGSDIDLLLVSDEIELEMVYEALTPVEEQIDRRVAPILYTSDEFRHRRSQKFSFVTRVLEKPYVILIGSLDV